MEKLEQPKDSKDAIGEKETSEDQIIDKAVKQAELEMEKIKDSDIAEKMAYSTKDFMDIYADVIKKVEQVEKELGGISIEEELVRIENEARENDTPLKDWFKAYKRKETDYIIKTYEAKRLRDYAGIFDYKGRYYTKRMSSDIKRGERENLSREDLSKKISWQALFAKINGLYWKMQYKIHGVNIRSEVERSSYAGESRLAR